MISLPVPLEMLDDLQASYILALDSQNMTQWLDSFSDQAEASYVCTTQENERRNLPLALMMDDCRARLLDRVTYVTKIWAGTFQNYQTRHLTQRLSAVSPGENRIEMETSLAVYCTPDETGVSMLLATGTYRDIVVREQSRARFLSKRVVLDTFVMPRYLVYPI